MAALVVAPAALAQQRIISTDAALTAIVEALDAGDRLVAVDVTSRPAPARAGLPRVGYHRALAAEGLLSLEPDLLLVSEYAGPPTTLDALRGVGVTVAVQPAATSIDELLAAVDRVADLLAVPEAGAALRRALEAKAQQVARRRLDGPRTVIVREGDGGLRVAGEGTAADALVEVLGGQNALDFSGYRSFSPEALLATDPDLLLLISDDPSADSDWLERYPLLRHSRAVQSGRVAAVSAAGLVGGLSLVALDEAVELLESLAPDRVADSGRASAP